MKILISIDLEGASGIVHWMEDFKDQRQVMTNDAIAIASGLRGCRVIIKDAHAGGMNIDYEKLPSNIELIKGRPTPLGMMDGVEHADAAILAGYHSGIGTPRSLMDHTFSSATVHCLTLNGKEMNEALMNTYLAGYFKRPVIMVTGDDVFIESVKPELDPQVEYVITKYGLSRYAARCRPPEEVRKELADKAGLALSKIDKIKPLTPPPPYKLNINLFDTTVGDLLELVPGAKRISGREVIFEESDYLKLFRLFRLALNFGITAGRYREK